MLDLLSVVQDKEKGMRGQGVDFLLAAWFLKHNGLIGMKMREDEDEKKMKGI